MTRDKVSQTKKIQSVQIKTIWHKNLVSEKSDTMMEDLVSCLAISLCGQICFAVIHLCRDKKDNYLRHDIQV